MQTLFRGSTQLGSRSLSTVYFNVRRQALLIATNVIGLLEHDAEDTLLSQLISHSKPINIVLYNQLFHTVGTRQRSLTRPVHILRQFLDALRRLRNLTAIRWQISSERMIYTTAGNGVENRKGPL